MTGPEKSEEDRFVRWCEKKKLLCLKLAAVGRRGFPDRTVFLPTGKTLFLEFKAPRGKISPHQERFIYLLQQMGHLVHVVYSADEAIAAVEDLL